MFKKSILIINNFLYLKEMKLKFLYFNNLFNYYNINALTINNN